MNSVLAFLAVIAVILLLCALIGARNRKEEEAALRSRFIKEFGGIPSKKMSALRYEKVPAWYLRHQPEDGIDEITWNDLDLDAVYRRMDSTLSGAGEEYLYALLRSPVPARHSGKSGDRGGVSICQIRWLEDDANAMVRLALQKALARLGHSGSYSVYEYLDRLEEAPEESNRQHILTFLLPAGSIALLFASVPAGVVCLIASLCYNMVMYYRRRGEIEPYIMTFSYILRMLRCADELCAAECSAFAGEQKELKQLSAGFAKFRRWSGILLSGSAVSSGNPVDIAVDYVRILFHIDLIKFNTMLSEAKGLRDEIDGMISILGRVDASIALASFERSLPYTCIPVLDKTDENPGTGKRKGPTVEGVYHPLLAEPVPNDIDLSGPILLTGSNASGKSTFLKALALCSLLAQTIGFCPARSYRGTIYRIRSSMALRDSIQSGESYFMVEIRSLKRIADLSGDGGRPVLCFIDEVLRGTNTVERIAASTEILTVLAQRGVLCCAATHDMELSVLLDQLYANYHFEEEIRDGDVVFSYHLHEGRAASRNAIRLLEAVGFEEGITARAQSRAESFERTGEWQTQPLSP